METYGWQAALLVTSLPSLLLAVLWWFVARDMPEQHPWVKPAELAELSGNPPTTPLRRSPRAACSACLGDPQILLVTLSYLVDELRLLPRDVLELPVPRAGPETLRPRERLARAHCPIVAAGFASATGGRIADRLR